jgi:hypothetical protein
MSNVSFLSLLIVAALSAALPGPALAADDMPSGAAPAAPLHGPSANALRFQVKAPPATVLKSVKLHVTVIPPTGIVAVYGSPPGEPVIVKGEADIDLPTTGPLISIDNAGGATDVDAKVLSYR